MKPTNSHWGNYRRLWSWLKAQERNQIQLSFSQIEDILGFPLPPSSREAPSSLALLRGQRCRARDP